MVFENNENALMCMLQTIAFVFRTCISQEVKYHVYKI